MGREGGREGREKKGVGVEEGGEKEEGKEERRREGAVIWS